MKVKKQKNEKECGLHVVEYFIRKFYDKRIPLSTLRKKVEFTENGISLQQLTRLAREYKIELRSFEVTANDLFESGADKEFIALVNTDGYNHYVVCKLNSGKVIIKDSIKGKAVKTQEEFAKIFLNIVSFAEKIKLVKEKNTKPSRANNLEFALSKTKLFFIGSITVFLSIVLMLISMIFTKLILDKVLPHHLEDMLLFAVIVFMIIVGMRVSIMVLKNIVIKRIQNIYELELTEAFVKKIFNADKEISKFTQNDILRRWSFINSISSMFANGFFVIFSEALIFISSLAILIWISSNVFAIVLAFGLLIIINISTFSFISRSKTDGLLTRQLNHINASNDFVRNMTFVKNPVVFNKLSKIIYEARANAKNSEMSLFSINLLHRVFCELLTLALPIAITFVCSTLIFDNKLTVGQMMLMISSSTFFFGSLNDISSFIFSYVTFRKESSIFDELIAIKDEEKNLNGIQLQNISNIQFENYSFSYDKKVFDIPNLTIDSDIRITGKNGSGKSTFLKCIAGLIKGQGVVKINNMNTNLYSLDSLRSNFLLITNDIYLPKMKIIDYVCDDENDKKIFENNLQSLGLYTVIENAKLELNSEMVNGGQNFSSGQRQIIMLLKAFAQVPKPLLLDEAFENIDSQNFELFKKAFEQYQEIIIEVSHSKKFVKKGKEVNFEHYI